MKNFLRLNLVALTAIALLLGGVSFAQTEDTEELAGGSGFRVSPARDDMTIERGTTKTRKIRVRNVTNTAQTARAVVNDFTTSGDETGSPQILVGADEIDNFPTSIKPFVLSLNDIILAPGEEKEVLVTLSVPEDTSPGSYFGLIRFVRVSDGDRDNLETSALALNASVGVIYLVDVPGETVDLLNLESVSVVKDGNDGSLFSSAPDSVAIRLKNDGNTFQAPFGKVLVKNWSGDVVHEYEINSSDPRGNVLPDSIRRFEDPLENIGSFGRFTIEANISYGDGSNIISSTQTFWVVPWTQVGLALLILIVVAVVGTRGLKTYNKKIVAKSKSVRVKKK